MPASAASTDDESDNSQMVDYEQMNAYEILGVGINVRCSIRLLGN